MPPRVPPATALDRRIQEIVARASAEIAKAVRDNIADEVRRMVEGRVSVAPAPASERAAAHGPPRRRKTILCPVSGCGKPGGGPKWGWFCAEHKDLSHEEKEQARAASRATQTRSG